MKKFLGKSVYGGIVIGKLFVYKQDLKLKMDESDYRSENSEQEINRYF